MESAGRVLVLDDDEGIRSAFARVLTREGYTVQIAESAEEALRHVGLTRPDAILLDLKMPMINGVGFLYRLRQNPANKDIAVAMITGERTLDDATVTDVRMLNARIFYKPLSLDDVRRVVRTLLTRGEAGTTPER